MVNSIPPFLQNINRNSNPIRQKSKNDEPELTPQRKIQLGRMKAKDAFKLYQIDRDGQTVSKVEFMNFWDIQENVADAIYATYDRDGNGMDLEEYTKYQNEYVASLKNGFTSEWHAKYKAGIEKGRIDYSTFVPEPPGLGIKNNSNKLDMNF